MYQFSKNVLGDFFHKIIWSPSFQPSIAAILIDFDRLTGFTCKTAKQVLPVNL
jgi:hypothetical protein